MKIRTLAASVAVALSASLLPACSTTSSTQPGVVGVDREQRFLVSTEQINQASEQAYAQVMADAQKKGVLNRDAAHVQRVRAITQRLIPASSAFRQDAAKWKWEANVISSPEVNAWAMPGGKIAVYTGIIEKLKLTDDELAAIMGHEVAHALREHGRERASAQMAQSTVLGIGAAILGIGEIGQALSQAVLDVTFNLPHSRQDEVEADRIGVELAARAGYDPRAAVTLWQKMAQMGGGGGPSFLSTHPEPGARMSDLAAYAQKVMPLYEARRKAGASAGN